ncbi:hypothetical protein J2X43_004288 [Rhizobium sp. BE258]|nr:hypothetical protein [Rhizobium sp. BE258]
MDRELPDGKARRHCDLGEIHGGTHPVGIAG